MCVSTFIGNTVSTDALWTMLVFDTILPRAAARVDIQLSTLIHNKQHTIHKDNTTTIHKLT